MKPLICENIAPPEVYDILHELSVDNEASEFALRTVRAAENVEGLKVFDTTGKSNSRTLALLFMLQARMAGQSEREKLLAEGDFITDFTQDEEDLTNWSGLSLAMLFASDWLLDKMIAQIPSHVRSAIISQMPLRQHVHARSLFTN